MKVELIKFCCGFVVGVLIYLCFAFLQNPERLSNEETNENVKYELKLETTRHQDTIRYMKLEKQVDLQVVSYISGTIRRWTFRFFSLNNTAAA